MQERRSQKKSGKNDEEKKKPNKVYKCTDF